MAETTQFRQQRPSFAEVDNRGEVWEYAALVTSLSDEILTLGPLYRDHEDCENTYDELTTSSGWGGRISIDEKSARAMMARKAVPPAWPTMA